MPNPFSPFRPAVRALATQGRVLPAAGQAIVDLAGPDQEEAYDRAAGDGNERMTTIWERPRRHLCHSVDPLL